MPTICQLTPPRPRNPYFTAFVGPLRNSGWRVILTTDLDRVSELVEEERPRTVVHVHQLEALTRDRTLAGTQLRIRRLLTKLASWQLRGAGVVHTLHNRKPHDLGETHNLDMALSRGVASMADRLIVLGEGAVRVAEALTDDPKVDVVPHPHYIGAYGPRTSQQDARDALGIEKDEFLFLSLGELRRYKNHDLILRAFEYANLDNTRLVIAGRPSDDTYARDLSRRAAGIGRTRVRLVDVELDSSGVRNWLCAADVGVYAFDNLIMSGGAMVALSYGLPVIVPDTGVLREYVEHNSNGLLYDKGEVGGLTTALRRARNIGLGSQADVIDSVSHLDPQDLVESLIASYKAALARR